MQSHRVRGCAAGVCSVCLFKTGLASLDNENDEAFEPTIARMLKDFGDYELLEESDAVARAWCIGRGKKVSTGLWRSK